MEEDIFQVSDEPDYLEELEIMKSRGFLPYVVYAYRIKQLLDRLRIPFFIRGSAGSSVVLYRLGLTTVDPRSYGAVRERFIHSQREQMGDIDFDLPSGSRPLLFRHLQGLFGNDKIVCRISNHVFFKEKSALRHSLRNDYLYRKKISSEALEKKCEEFPGCFQKTTEYVGQFHHYSKHVGGICIVTPDTFKTNRCGSGDGLLPQIRWNKQEVERQGMIKIDLLSNNALQILSEMDPQFVFKPPEEEDERVMDLFRRADTLGIFYAESPMMRECLRKYRPKNILDLAICFAVIRPSNKTLRQEIFRLRSKKSQSHYIFDDDVIQGIALTRDLPLSEADTVRREIMKKQRKGEAVPFWVKKNGKLTYCHLYGFCKSHAMHYAILMYWTAYYKVHHMETFYRVLFSSLCRYPRSYRKWVYAMDCIQHGFSISPIYRGLYKKQRWHVDRSKKRFACDGHKSQTFFKPLSVAQQIQQFDFFSGCLQEIPDGQFALQRGCYRSCWCAERKELVDIIY